MALVSFSNARYTGAFASQSIIDFAVNDAEKLKIYKKIAGGFLESYIERVFADGGVIQDLASLESAAVFVMQNSLSLSNIEAASASWGVKLDANGKVTKLYNIGSNNRDFVLKAGAKATISSQDGFKTLSLQENTYFGTESSFSLGEEIIFAGATSVAGVIIATSNNTIISSATELSEYIGNIQVLFRTSAGLAVQLNPTSSSSFDGLAGVLGTNDAVTLYKNGQLDGTASGATRDHTTPNRFLFIGALYNGSTVTLQPSRIAESWFIKSSSQTVAQNLSSYLDAKY